MPVRSGKYRRGEAQSKSREHVSDSDGALSVQRATDQLATRVMGWRTAPDRFIKSNRSWIPRWRFQPFAELADAFQILDRAARHYTLSYDGRTFTADVQTDTGRGVCSGEHKPKAITLALARALGLEVDG